MSSNDHAPDDGFTARFRFDWPSPPLTANQRMHWRKKADITANVRSAAALRALDLPVRHLPRIDVTLTWVVRTKHRRDADNVVPTLKAICDGIVDAGVVDDDTPEFMVKHMPVIRYDPDATPHMELTIREVRS